MPQISPALIAPLFASAAVFLFSGNDVLMKFLSGDYALHQIVLTRSVMGLALTVLIMAPLAGGFHLLRTRRPGLHMARAACVFFANMP